MSHSAIRWVSALAVSIYVWWRTSIIDGPFLFHDEFGYVAVSRWLAGPLTPELYGPMYHPGYGLLLTPLAAIVGDPTSFHAWAVTVNTATVGLIMVATLALGNRLDVPFAARLAAGAVACTTSAMVVFAGMLIAEVLLTLVVTVCVLAVWSLLEKPSTALGILVGLSLSISYLIHPRAIVLVIALGLTVAAEAFWNHLTKGHVVAVVTAVVGSLVTLALTGIVADSIYAEVIATDTGFLLSNAIENPGLLVRAVGGTAWYMTASTFGLAIWGAIAALRLVIQQRGAKRTLGLFVCLSLSGSLLLSGIFTAGILANAAQSRPDVITYGRYVEHWLPVLIIFGVAELIATANMGTGRGRWSISAFVLTSLVLIAGPLIFSTFEPATRSGPAAISNSSALGWFWFQTLSLDLTRWGWIAVPVVLSIIWAGQHRYWIPLAALCLWAQLAIGSTINDWARPAADSWQQRGQVEGSLLDSPYLYEPDSNPLDIYGLQYWQPELDVEVILPRGN